ncbi:TonB-dependent receptor [Dyella solisilvae]|uniref:TonB-dependent receptor n=2 Tax=Dyella solisilvae TaxID=1920168 RepID=A0A370K9F7_9GAMM|nr:TonB-dependent receptor [Dyella solisilvae]
MSPGLLAQSIDPAAVAALPAVASVATPDDASTLAPVTVTGTADKPLPIALATAPAVVESLSAQQIHDTVNLMTTAESLKYLPSIEVRERYIGDRNGIVATRTTGTVSSAESLVYADDLLLSNLLGNSYSFPPRWGLVSPAEIARVNVMYGPFSALYPGNSMGGVVTLETRMPTKAEFHAAVTGAMENFDLYGTSQRNMSGDFNLAAGNRWGPISLWVTYDHLDAQGHPMSFSTSALSSKAAGAGATPVTGAYQDLDQSGKARMVFGAYSIDHSLQDQGKLKLGWDITPEIQAIYTFGLWHNDSTTSVQSYLTNTSTGQPFYNGSASIDGHAYTVSGLNPGSAEQLHMVNALSVGSDTHGAFDWHAAYSNYRFLKDNSRSASRYGQSDVGSNQVQDGTGWQTGDLRGTWRPAPLFGQTHELTFGYHIDDFLLKQNTYALANWSSGPNGALTAASGGETRTQALYLQDVWTLAPRWTLTLGGRQEYWRAFDGFNRNVATTPNLATYPNQQRSDFSPKAALDFQITQALATRLSFGRAIRYPTVTELYQQVTSGSQLVQNNPNLKPEDSRSFDWTTLYSWGTGVFRVSLFQENRHNALFSQTDTSISPNLTQIENIDRARIRGVESALDEEDVFVEGLNFSGSVTYAESVVQQDTLAPAAVGKQFPRIPRWRARMSATYHPNDRLTYALGYRYSSGAYSTLLNTDINQDVYGGISSYSVFDAKVSYRLEPRLTASIGVDNIGNQKYFVSPHPYPQRTVFVGLNYDY